MTETGIILIVLQLFSKILGFIRELVLSYFYGATIVSDAYLIAFTIPGIIFAIVSAGITGGFIPIYNKIDNIEGEEKANYFTSNFLNLVIIICIFLATLISIFPDTIVDLFASGFTGEKYQLTVDLMRISTWSIVFLAITTVAVPFLNIKKSFIVSSSIGFPLNIGLISGIYLSYKLSNNYFLAYGIVLGFSLQAIMLMFVLQAKGYQHTFKIDIKNKYIKQIIFLSLPMILGAGANQLNIIVDRTIASFLQTGAISSLNYANRLNSFIQGVLIVPLVTVLYPKFAKLVVSKKYEELSRVFYDSISVITLLTIPLVAIGMYLSEEITGVLFLRGAFDDKAFTMTSSAVFFYLIGIIGIAYREILFRVYYSFQDTKTPVKNSMITVCINIILNLILSRFMGVSGLALATSISDIISAMLLRRRLHHYIVENKFKSRFNKNMFKIIFSGVIMIVFLLLFGSIFPPNMSFLSIVTQATLGLLIYLLSLFLLKVNEIKIIKRVVKSHRIL